MNVDLEFSPLLLKVCNSSTKHWYRYSWKEYWGLSSIVRLYDCCDPFGLQRLYICEESLVPAESGGGQGATQKMGVDLGKTLWEPSAVTSRDVNFASSFWHPCWSSPAQKTWSVTRSHANIAAAADSPTHPRLCCWLYRHSQISVSTGRQSFDVLRHWCL